jgi:sphingomyelin phosphodiesterase
MEKSTDPANELEWLRHVLQEAENNHEFAFVFGHIPPGDLYC